MSFFVAFFSGNKMRYAKTEPVREVINWVSEKVVWKTFIMGAIFSGKSEGIIIMAMTIPIKAAFIIDPMTMDKGRPSLLLGLFFKKATLNTRIAFPTITQGIISGMADIIGLPVIMNDVMGVTTDKRTAQPRPAVSVQIMRQALMMGPVM